MGDLFSGLLQGLAAKDEIQGNRLERELARKRIELLTEQQNIAKTNLELQRNQQRLETDLAALEGIAQGTVPIELFQKGGDSEFSGLDVLEQDQGGAVNTDLLPRQKLTLPGTGTEIDVDVAQNLRDQRLEFLRQKGAASATVQGKRVGGEEQRKTLGVKQEFEENQNKLDRALETSLANEKNRIDLERTNITARSRVEAARLGTLARERIANLQAASRIEAAKIRSSVGGSVGAAVNLLSKGLSPKGLKSETTDAAIGVMAQQGLVPIDPKEKEIATTAKDLVVLVDDVARFVTSKEGKALFATDIPLVPEGAEKLGKKATNQVFRQKALDKMKVFQAQVGKIVGALEGQPGSRLSDKDVLRGLEAIANESQTFDGVVSNLNNLRKLVRDRTISQFSYIQKDTQRADFLGPIFSGTSILPDLIATQSFESSDSKLSSVTMSREEFDRRRGEMSEEEALEDARSKGFEITIQ